jgi:hypothetical protein
MPCRRRPRHKDGRANGRSPAEVQSDDAPVRANDVNVGHDELGGTTLGATLRAGFDFQGAASSSRV